MRPYLFLGLGLVLVACDPPAAATALFQVPRDLVDQEFYALPFPNDVRLGDGGHPVLDDYPRPVAIVGQYLDAIETLDGWGTNAALFQRFSGAIDPGSLPSPEATLADPRASVYLVDVDPDSPTRGQRWPLRFRFQTYGGWTIGDNWLSALPYPGFPLAERTTYALVVTERLHAAGGGDILPSLDWLAMRDPLPAGAVLEPEVARAQALYQPLWDYLDEPGGDERADVVSAAVFTTQSVTGIMADLRTRIWSLPAPEVHDVLEHADETPGFVVFDGVYEAPNFQTGAAPYRNPEDGGDIVYGDDHLPTVQRTETIRVSFSVPRGPMPAAGWPLVLYAHGTGGGYHSYLGDGTAGRFAGEGLAMMSIDQVLHGPRNPTGDPELDFFNFQNPLSARNNPIQGALDDFSLLRLALAMRYHPGAESQIGYPEIKFDPSRIYFFGHSQGGLTGPPFLAYEPLVAGAVLSGAGGSLYYALLEKTEPFDIRGLVGTVILDNPLDEFNPVLALLQTWIERSDPLNYGPLLALSPARGPDGNPMRPKAIFQSLGVVDHYTPIPNIEALATAIGGNVVGTVLEPIEGLTLRHREVLAAPVTDNLPGATVVLSQYRATTDDGHFVVFDVPAARLQSSRFLGTLAATGKATLVAP